MNYRSIVSYIIFHFGEQVFGPGKASKRAYSASCHCFGNQAGAKRMPVEWTVIGDFLRRFFPLLALLGLRQPAAAQTPFPELAPVFQDQGALPRIDLWLPPDSLSVLLAPGNEASDYLWHATFVFTDENGTDTVKNAGLSLRGNTSRTAKKKSYKVSFNTYEPGRKWRHLEKLNLNGQHNDPTVARSKIAWDLLRRMGVPAPRANHVDLYLNGVFFGLYINVEHIDEQFTQLRFGNNDGNLYKCLYPADLAYKGSDPNLYKATFSGRPAYELQNNEAENDYADLAHFIDVLNNTPLANLPCELEKVLNVDGCIRSLAFDVLSGNWDGPAFNKNNFYLYHNTAGGRFELIPYDLDNTLGIDWLNMNWTNRNIYAWAPATETRPIYSRLLAVPDYKDRFSYYIKSFAATLFSDAFAFPYIDSLKNRIAPSAAADLFRTLDYGFTFYDFNKSYTQALPFFHTPTGLKPYFVLRRESALQQLSPGDIKPVLTNLTDNHPNSAQSIQFAASVIDDGLLASVQVCYQLDGQNLVCADMHDDGAHLDGPAGDGRYGAVFPPPGQAALLEYYVQATDAAGQYSRAPRCGFQAIAVGNAASPLVVNEFMASNTKTVQDEAGEYDDWVELLNTGDAPLFLGNIYLTDNENIPDKWKCPAIWMQPQQHLLFWADGDTGQGPNHTGFKLDAGGEFIGVFEHAGGDLVRLDGYSFGMQEADAAVGRLPDGYGPFQPLRATPGAANQALTGLAEADIAARPLAVFPNPSAGLLYLFVPATGAEDCLLTLTDARGRVVRRQLAAGVGRTAALLDISDLPSGLYAITCSMRTGIRSATVVKR